MEMERGQTTPAAQRRLVVHIGPPAAWALSGDRASLDKYEATAG
jgi:hypothetical protein